MLGLARKGGGIGMIVIILLLILIISVVWFCIIKMRQNKLAIHHLECLREELSKHYGEEISGYIVDKIIDQKISELKGE